MASQTHSKGGRPTKYKPEYAEQLIEYFESYLKEPFTQQVVGRTTKYYPDGKVKEADEQYKVFPKGVPTIFGFARSIGVWDTTLQDWAKRRIGEKPEDGKPDLRPLEYPEFYRAYKQAVKYQTEFFNHAASSGMGSAAWMIFAAKNMIRWRDKIETGLTDSDGKDVKPDYVLLPQRLPDEKAKEEYAQQTPSPYLQLPVKLNDASQPKTT